jgi:hypothetical protein
VLGAQGYGPTSGILHRGVPAKLTFIRKVEQTCGRALVRPSAATGLVRHPSVAQDSFTVNGVLNAYGRSHVAIPHQSNPASLRHSLAHWCIPAPPVHGQRSPKRVK